MPKPKKTRKQKIAITEKKLETLQYSYNTATETVKTAPQPQSVKVESITNFFRYDSSLNYKDLFKTVVISFILIASLVIISIYLR